jgi:hypothetical protein
MATPLAIPVKGKPGTLFIPSLGKEITQVDSREDDFYDSVGSHSGSITNGTAFNFFDNFASKSKQHTNLTKPHHILGGHELTLGRIGYLPRLATGNTLLVPADFKKLTDCPALECKLGTRVIAEGPCFKFQSGYGLSGNTQETGQGIVSVGVASANAAPTLIVPQDVTDEDDIFGTLTFWPANWLNTTDVWALAYTAPNISVDWVVTLFFHGIIRKAMGR